MAMVSIADIKVVDRHRLNFGDIASLAQSMQEIGQLQPVLLTKDLRLVAGGRRLEAANSLGWLEIDAKVIDDLTDAADLLRAERDENTCRKAFTPTEEHSLYAALLDLGSSRQEGDPVTSKTKAAISEIVSGSANRHRTLAKIGEVKDLASDSSLTEKFREVAKEALTEIDRTGNISGPYRRVKIAERAARTVQGSKFDDWTADELELMERLKTGKTIVVSMRDHHANLVAWAQVQGKFEPIDRRSEWGNPFELPYDGDRGTVIRNYAEFYLPHKPSLLDRIHELRGMALGCWCAPEPCHGDVLRELAES